MSLLVWKRRLDWRIDELAAWLAVVVVSVVWFGWVSRAGVGHAYYSGSARTLSEHPGWWFSGAFDPGGFVTVDKPPVGVWATAVGVWLFGAGSVGFVLPGAVMAWWAAWFASRTVLGGSRVVVLLVVLVTPAMTVLARSSLPDATMLAAGCAAAAVLVCWWGRAPYVSAGVLLGVAVLAKPGAVLMVPAFVVFAMVSPSMCWRRFAGFVSALVLVIGVWVLAASMTPDRPFFGGSTSDSAVELLLGPSTADRVLDADLTSGDRWIGLASAGEPGILRAVSGRMGRQAGFLLVFALVGGLELLRGSTPGDRAVAAFWLTWLVVHAAVYSSLPGIAHAYYAASLGPPIAVLAVMVVSRASGRVGWLTLVGLALSLYVTFQISTDLASIGATSTVGVLVAGATVGAVSAARRGWENPVVVTGFIGVVGVMAVLSVDHLLIERTFSFDPAAGDQTSALSLGDPELIEVVSTSSARWAVATDDEVLASTLIASQGVSVMLVGGFLSRDPILTAVELEELIVNRHIGYVAKVDDPESPAGRLITAIWDLCEPVAGIEGLRSCQ